MSTLKTHNLQSPDAGSVNIAMTPNAGMVVTGVSTFSSGVDASGTSIYRGPLQVQDNLEISGEIVHLSDTDTRMTFPSNDTISFKTAGEEALRITSGGHISMRRSVTPLSGTGNPFSFNLYRDSGTGYGYIDCVTGTVNTAGVKIRGYSNTVYTNAFDHYAGVTKLAAGTINDRITLGSREITIKTTSYPETNEYLAVFNAGVASGNRFKNRYIKIRNNYTGSTHGGVPIVWEANADGSNNKSYAAIVTEGNGDIRFLNAPSTSEKAIGTDLLGTISEKLRITTDGRILFNTTSTTNTDDFLTIKRPASGHSAISMTVDATTATGNYANAFVFTKSKGYYYNGLVFSSSDKHEGGIVGRTTGSGSNNPSIELRVGGTAINASDTLAMKINHSGYVTKPAHPSFHARLTSHTNASANPLVFDDVIVNVGSHYKSTGSDAGKFVAPVAGTYFFFWEGIKNNMNGSVARLYLMKNNVKTYNNMHLRLQEEGQYANGCMNVVMTLAEGDKIHINLSVGGVHASEYTHFGGYLVG